MILQKKGADESEESEGVDVKEFDAAFIVQHGLKEMQEIEITFEEQLVKSLSLKVDLRVYEDFVVKFDDGKVGTFWAVLDYSLFCSTVRFANLWYLSLRILVLDAAEVRLNRAAFSQSSCCIVLAMRVSFKVLHKKQFYKEKLQE